MEQYKREFIEFMVESDVLKFGEFTLKSGRKSPSAAFWKKRAISKADGERTFYPSFIPAAF